MLWFSPKTIRGVVTCAALEKAGKQRFSRLAAVGRDFDIQAREPTGGHRGQSKGGLHEAINFLLGREPSR
jgi:hypothetical protein